LWRTTSTKVFAPNVTWNILRRNVANALIKYRPSRITFHHNILAGSSRNPQARIDDTTTAGG
jgi:hypothetical protein